MLAVSFLRARGRDVEAEHHPALDVLGYVPHYSGFPPFQRAYGAMTIEGHRGGRRPPARRRGAGVEPRSTITADWAPPTLAPLVALASPVLDHGPTEELLPLPCRMMCEYSSVSSTVGTRPRATRCPKNDSGATTSSASQIPACLTSPSASAHHRCRTYRRRGSLATAHQRTPNPATRTLDLHGNCVEVAPIVAAPEPRVEALHSLLGALPAPEHRRHPQPREHRQQSS